MNIGSKVAETGQGGTSAYAAANGGRNALTREWAVELAKYGIRVNAVIVAECWTPMYETWLSSQPDPAAARRQIEARIPLGRRMTTAEEIAHTVAFPALRSLQPYDRPADSRRWRLRPSRPRPMTTIRPEQPADWPAVHAVHCAAFPTDAEARLVDRLRANGKAAVSLVAAVDGQIVGHVLFSPVTIGGQPWATVWDLRRWPSCPAISGGALAAS